MHCWARTAFYLLVTVLGIASMIGACGQKGPLYLPERPIVEVSAPAADLGSDVPSAPVAPPESAAPPDRP
ncbi:LPS translocon maturation chaperone LptM [Thiocapsa rosea]|uniref:Putative lipoprotein n=1 Tax=Thiocapsa rosea TaxID=69360 RepID=A0A495V3I0_9GAMM|nr:lipoprotein [Thiocapsa rosea]RKT43879.1 putative lipoprotein [Thiocapsa rosea]